MGQLPCPECGSKSELKTDGRKHTLKCQHCGMLAYYQTKDAKAHIEERLRSGELNPRPSVRTVTLVLPDDDEGPQYYRLTLTPLAIMPMTEAANDEGDDEIAEAPEVTNTDNDKDGFFSFLNTMFE